jgi:hypothetical protein
MTRAWRTWKVSVVSIWHSCWRIVPAGRRTSRPDRVDILDGDGRFVAGYVQRADALRMIHDAAQIADEAIGLVLEFRDAHACDEDNARVAAILEITEPGDRSWR